MAMYVNWIFVVITAVFALIGCLVMFTQYCYYITSK
jgi:hypothetical protein